MTAVGEHEYLVDFGNGYIEPCESNKLTIVPDSDIPLELRPENDAEENESLDGSNESFEDDSYVVSNMDEVEDEDELEADEYEEEDDENLPSSQETDVALFDENGTSSDQTYADRLAERRRMVDALEGFQVHTRSSSPRQSMVWTVVGRNHAIATRTPKGSIGLRPEYLDDIIRDGNSNGCLAAELFLCLMFGTRLNEKISKFNRAIDEDNQLKARSIPIPTFSKPEFMKGLALIIGAACYAAKGEALWENKREKPMLTLEPKANFEDHMFSYRFKQFREFLPVIYRDYSVVDSDPWWKFASAVNEFNRNRLLLLAPSNHLCIDEMMSAWKPRKTKLGGLPNITHIPRKPEPLGTEFKCVACSQTGCMLNLEIQRGKDGMRDARYNRELGNTAGCTIRLAEER